jgi:hypothetical protein
MKQKRGQEGADGVYILLILMGLFIVLYVVLLPPADRASLLNETTSTSPGSAPAKSVLLSESPGMVYAATSKEQTISIEPLKLFSKEELSSSLLVKSLAVSRNLIKNNYKNIYFDLDDLQDLKKVELLFLIKESKGPISIYLNNKLIYEGVLSSSDLPLELPLNYLQNKNKLELRSASPGLKIFSSNYYLLQDVTLLKTLKKENKRVSRVFAIAEDVGQNINRATLNYVINCNRVDQNPRLTVYLNSRKVFSDLISCSYLDERRIVLTKDVLNVYGRNRLEFEIDNGDIEIKDIKLKAKLRSSMYPSYSFDISNALWDKLESGESSLVLRLKFGTTGRKRANLYIQDEKIGIDTTSGVYVRDITSMVDNGANVIKLVPLNDYEISNLRVAEE